MTIAIELTNYAKNEFGITKAENLTNKHVQAFLTDKIMDGVSRNYFQTLCSAISKFETALNWTAEKFDTNKQYHFNSALTNCRNLAYESFGDLKSYNRAYENPQEILNNIRGENYQIAATFQFLGGFRVAECSNLLPEQFKGYANHPITGEKCGVIEIKAEDAKGGKERTAYVPVTEYDKAKAIADAKGVFHVDNSTYRDRLKEVAPDYACKDGVSKSTHGLRWCFAQNMMKVCINSGFTYEKSLKIVSNLMGHERIQITEWYVNGGRK